MKLYKDEIIADNFAGGGGASTGIELALGRSVDIAINHDPEAIAMHAANHPNTEHYCESIWDVDPVKAVRGRKVGLCWFSPDCKHFSKAKGSTPVDKNIRGLAWIALRWASKVRPRIIMLENVEEFKTWGALIPKRCKKTGRVITKDNRVADKNEVLPISEQAFLTDKKNSGKIFNKFVYHLRELGYVLCS